MKNEIKNAVSQIKPDACMKVRLSEKIACAKPKRNAKRRITAAICCVMCFAVAAGTMAFYPGREKPQSGSDADSSVINGAENSFVLCVSAAESEQIIQIGTSKTALPDYRLSYDKYGDLHIKADNSFDVSGENIKSVKFSCDNGSFDYTDLNLINYLKKSGKYYDIIVPYDGEYQAAGGSRSALLKTMLAHIENGDYDSYFKAADIQKKSAGDYYTAELVYDEEDNPVGVGILAEETYKKCVGFNQKFAEFENINKQNENIIETLVWIPAVSDDAKYENFSDVPGDAVTVTVTFENGGVLQNKYAFAFNDDGALTAEKIN